MRSSIACIAVAVLLVGATSCSYHRAAIHYEEYADRMLLSEEPLDAEPIGEVAANGRGAFWNDCTRSAEHSLWVIIDDARRMGGNAIGDIRWLPKTEERSTKLPTCKKKWGWLAIWPVAVSAHFMSTRVEATVYRIPEGAEPRTGLYAIPDAPDTRHAVATRILDEASRVSCDP